MPWMKPERACISAGTGIPKDLENKEKEIEQLREAKLQAAQNQNYELAANLRDQVQQLQIELENMTVRWQNEQRSHPTEVNGDTVADVVSMMSGVPVSRVSTNENERLKGMKQALGQHVIAQNKAIERLLVL